MSGEFNLIDKYFVENGQPQRKDVYLVAGDTAPVKAPSMLRMASAQIP